MKPKHKPTRTSDPDPRVREDKVQLEMAKGQIKRLVDLLQEASATVTNENLRLRIGAAIIFNRTWEED